ncbi:hypothetical protein F444_14464 [Phytophthora nicotianae P1976]|uniref:Uncharacterized protein n=1 Tax=Phytophthora nicotianae P1976 TaxID=1317066 RepID=A0A080ZQ27_PHYNI|nr:hypothetical protein F444_14464 [Phytophthora nicotianae P1976]
MDAKKAVNTNSDTDTSTDMDVDDENKTSETSSKANSSKKTMDDQGRRVTTDRRRYEDSTGRLKAAQEREIDGKKMRTTWNRQNKEDEGQHESICSSGSPEEFEALWQQTPFGEAQKMKVKGQLQSESDVEERGDVNDSSTGACHNGGSTDGEAEIINREK